MKTTDKAREQLDKILEAFETGAVPEAIAKAMLPPFDVPSNAWSLNNRILMFFAGTGDARGIRQWREVGRWPRKGSKAFCILVPLHAKKKETDEDTGRETVRQILIGFKCCPVFAAEDTDGKPLEYPDVEPPEPPPLSDVAEAWNIEVKYLPGNEAYFGYYAPGREEIGLATHDAQTFFHELAHAAHRSGGTRDVFVTKLSTPLPSIALSRGRHSFGYVQVGNSRLWDLQVYNNGPGDSLKVQNAYTMVGNPFDVVSPTSFPKYVSVGDSLTVQVRFIPPSVDTFADTLVIASNDPYNAQMEVVLTGAGQDTTAFATYHRHWTSPYRAPNINAVAVGDVQGDAGREIVSTDGSALVMVHDASSRQVLGSFTSGGMPFIKALELHERKRTGCELGGVRRAGGGRRGQRRGWKPRFRRGGEGLRRVWNPSAGFHGIRSGRCGEREQCDRGKAVRGCTG